MPELAVGEDRGEVVQPDPLALVGDQLEEPVVLEREPAEEVDRVAEDRDDHDHGGQDQRIRDRGLGELRPPETAMPPERPWGCSGGMACIWKRFAHPAELSRSS